MPRIVHGLLLCGLSYDGSINPTLFTDGPLDASTISGLSPLTTSSVVVRHMTTAGISGAAARVSDLRDPLIASSSPSATLQDDAQGTLSEFFCPDSGYANTTRWVVLNTNTITAATTSIILTGDTAPTVNQIVYLHNEAIRIDSVSSSQNDHTCGVTRGVAGSRALTHSLDPSTYPPGDDGSRECLVVYSRRVYDGDRKIEAALYIFKMSDTNPHAISSVLWAWYGYLGGVPKQNTSFEWVIPVKHFTTALSEFQMRGGEELETKYCVQITQLSTGYGGATGDGGDIGAFSGSGARPSTVRFRFTPYEFERLFNIVARQAQTSVFTTSFSAINALLVADPRMYFEIVGEVGDHTWIWRVTSITTIHGVNGEVCWVNGTLVGASPGASCQDSPAFFTGGDGFYTRDEDVNAGFTFGIPPNDSYHVARIDAGEAPPKLKCRLRLSPCTFGEAALMLILSGYGGGVNNATYDLIPGGRGMQFNPSWVNIGSAPVTPKLVSMSTQEWEDHISNDEEEFEYAFTHETKLGDWFRNELLLRNMILAFVPSTGKIGPRIWARVGTHTAINPVVFPVIEIDAGESLKEQKAIFLERGIDGVTLDAKWRKPLQNPDARATDLSNAPTVRIWKQGGRFQDSEFESGSLALFLRAVFAVGIGSPRVFAVPLALDSGVAFADLVTWTDPSQPTATGRGFSSRKMICLGIDPNPREAITYAYCVEDLVNREADASASNTTKLGTALEVTGIVDIDTTNRTATLEVVGFDINQQFQIDTGDDNIWGALSDELNWVSIRTQSSHNPADTAGERQGYQEIYATVTNVTYNNAARKNYISISWTAAMGASRVTVDDVISLGATVQLPDYRPSGSAPGGATIRPLNAQGTSAQSNRVHINAVSRRPLWTSRRSLIGS